MYILLFAANTIDRYAALWPNGLRSSTSSAAVTAARSMTTHQVPAQFFIPREIHWHVAGGRIAINAAMTDEANAPSSEMICNVHGANERIPANVNYYL